MSKKSLFRGLTIVSTFLLSASIVSANVMEFYRDGMDQTFKTVSSKIVTEESENAEDAWNYDSQFKSAKDAFEGYKEFGFRSSEETAVLLKNKDKALPLTESTPKVTMLGLRSYAAVYGNSGGSTPDKASIDSGNTITEAFQKSGFELNPKTLAAYKKYCENLTWGGSGFGAIPPEYKEITTTTNIPELSPTELRGLASDYDEDYASYGDAAIVVVGRPAGEGKNYNDGAKGMDDGLHTTTGNIMGLSDDEMAIINEAKKGKADGKFKKVIVLINATNVMEFKNLSNDDSIDAIMWVGHPGVYGFYSVAKMLKGEVNPSAYLGDIYPTNNSDSPSMQNFGNIPWADPDDFTSADNVNSYLVEAEGIYTGYRYYETRYADIVAGVNNAATAKAGTYVNSDGTLATADGTWKYADEVNYPFGYGLSYTTFKTTLDDLQIMGNKKSGTAKVTVENTGDVAGKKAIQLYASVPYTTYDKTNNVEKSAIQLVNFEKTKLLQPGEKQTITVDIDMANLTSYDYTNAKTFILDDGDYYFTVGDDSHEALNNVLAAKGFTVTSGMTSVGDTSNVKTWTNDAFDKDTFSVSDNGTAITNKLSDGDYSMDLNSFMPNTVTYLSRSDWNGTYPKTYSGLVPTDRMKTLLKNDFIALSTNDDVSDIVWGDTTSKLTLNDMKGASYDDPRWDELLNKLTIDDFLDFASNAFHNIQKIDSVGYVGHKADDGPGGSDSYSFNKGMYRGQAWADAATSEYGALGTRVTASQENLAYSWNKELCFEDGELIIGETSLIFNLPIMIGPAMNIHRNGYNGRGGEYLSEDPILSGYIGSNMVQGAQSKGCLVNIKHAAFNDQEINRSGVCTFMNEQKARELELRNLQQAFEGKGKSASFKNDESKKNTFTTGALGVMTSYNRIGSVASSANKAVMVDIMRNEWGFKGYNVTDFTGVSPKAAPKESILAGTCAFCGFGKPSLDYWSAETLGKDRNMALAIKQNAHYILYALANSNAMNGVNSSSKRVELITPWRATYISLISIFGVLTLASLVSYGVFLGLDISHSKKKEEK